ncbi:MAG: hypothetical protein DWI57_02960 [Chloroflexi bacterium]|nr:MAG: hypothetical protein DWI57_02960 [Chloroflexota bacterium]
MKVNRLFAPQWGQPPVWTAVRLLALVVVLLIVAGCAPPAAPPAAPIAKSGIACEASPPFATTVFGAGNAERDEQGNYTYQQEVDSQRKDGRPRTIRLKLHESLVDRQVLPVEICPLTRQGPGYCADKFQPDKPDKIGSKEVEKLLSLPASRAIELFRFEIVDFAKWNGVSPEEPIEREVPTDALVNQFKEHPIEIWIEVYDKDKEAAAAAGGSSNPLGEEYSGIGYWSCVEGEFAWKDFTDVELVDEGDKQFLKARVDGWNDPAAGMGP